MLINLLEGNCCYLYLELNGWQVHLPENFPVRARFELNNGDAHHAQHYPDSVFPYWNRIISGP